MTSDAEIACPDPNCPSRLRITRIGLRRFSHAQTTATPRAGVRRFMSEIARVALRPDYEISRVIRGGWQLAGGHGAIDREAAIDDLVAAFDAGVTTFDCADIYTGVEELYRRLPRPASRRRAARRRRKSSRSTPSSCPISQRWTPSTRSRYRGASSTARSDACAWSGSISCSFTGGTTPRRDWLEAVGWLDELRRAGKIRHVGCTNFDTRASARSAVDRRRYRCSVQAQYSVLDARPENGLAALCRAHGVWLLCYGIGAGGFLSDRWLGAPEPAAPLENRSLVKYKLIIDDFGGWELFQELLRALRRIADRHGVDIATSRAAMSLDRPRVAGGDRRRARSRASRRQRAHRRGRARRRRQGRDLGGARARDGAARRFYDLERDRPGGMVRSCNTTNNARIEAETEGVMRRSQSRGDDEAALALRLWRSRRCAARADCTITVGLVMELTGPAGEYGQAGAKSVEMAFRDLNDAGGAAWLQARRRHARFAEPGHSSRSTPPTSSSQIEEGARHHRRHHFLGLDPDPDLGDRRRRRSCRFRRPRPRRR